MKKTLNNNYDEIVKIILRKRDEDLKMNLKKEEIRLEKGKKNSKIDE